MKMKAVFKETAGNDSNSKYFLNGLTEIPSLGKYGLLIAIRACSLSDDDDQVIRNATCRSVTTGNLPVGYEVSGVVKQIGNDVTAFKKGDEVVGIIPLDYNMSGCADFVALNTYDVVKKPEKLSFVDAAACIGDGVKAYTALHYLGRVRSGETVLVVGGASPFGTMVIQLANHWGAKVMATANDEHEVQHLQAFQSELAAVINTNEAVDVRALCMEETAGLGVDIVVDGSNFPVEKGDSKLLSKHDIISCLAVGGRWVTQCHNLQLDPPDSQTLFLKCASVCFLFEKAWTLSGSQQGRYQHILTDIIGKVDNSTIRPFVSQHVTLDSVPETMKLLGSIKFGKVMMVA